jgi:hypothetical protein
LKVNPLEISAPQKDDSIRPGGISCRIEGWLPRQQPWANVSRVPIVLTEYPDPDGKAIYFTVPGEGVERLTDDELI